MLNILFANPFSFINWTTNVGPITHSYYTKLHVYNAPFLNSIAVAQIPQKVVFCNIFLFKLIFKEYFPSE